MAHRSSSLAVVLILVLGLVACGSGGDKTVTETFRSGPGAGATNGDPASADYSACSEAAESRELEEEMIATGEKGIEEGEEVKTAESLVKEAEKSLRESDENCAVEANLEKQETKICRNTPQELAEALEIEDTPGNREYIGVYEATCGKHVPIR